MKKTLLISSLIIIAVLSAEAYRENLNMKWQTYQKKYKSELRLLAKTKQEKITVRNYKIKMRQIVMPKFNNRADRCVTCHVAMEDSRMSDMPNPLKSHPGNYLDTHDITQVGCTFCHDGQGRAITADDAHAQASHKYWEKPILQKPFIQANCVRCHMNKLPELTEYNKGKELFGTMGCTACHKIKGEGGTIGPDLTNISNASFHIKAPIEENREALLEKYHHNINLAYLQEAVATPAAQPAKTTMPDYGFSEEDVTALMVYLKSLTSERSIMDIGTSEKKPTTRRRRRRKKGTKKEESAPIKKEESSSVEKKTLNPGIIKKPSPFSSAKGKKLFEGTKRFFNDGPSCISCHSVRNDKMLSGGSLAVELTTIFSKLGKEGILSTFKNSSFHIKQEAYKDKKLSKNEMLSLIAFLEKVNKESPTQKSKNYGQRLAYLGFLGTFLLLGIYTIVWYQRKENKSE